MNLDEKTCQLATYYGYKKALEDSVPTAAWKTNILKDGIANVDEHLNKEIGDPNTLATALAETQRFFVEYTRLGIPVDFTNEGIEVYARVVQPVSVDEWTGMYMGQGTGLYARCH